MFFNKLPFIQACRNFGEATSYSRVRNTVAWAQTAYSGASVR